MRSKCFVLQRITWVHYISLQVLLTAAFILWPPCTCGFGIREKMRFAVFWRISVRFCGFRTLLTPPSFLTLPLTLYSDDSPYIHCIRTLGAGETRKRMRVLQVSNLEKNPTIYSCGCNLKCFSLLRSINSNTSSHCLLQQ